MLEPKKRKRTSSEMTFLNDGKKDIKITALGGSNGQRGHAVAVVDKMVFDSNVKNPMWLCQSTLNWCVSDCMDTLCCVQPANLFAPIVCLTKSRIV